MPVLPGGIPNIQTLAHIDTVLKRLPAWRGEQRVLVLEACEHRLAVLRQAAAIDAPTLTEYRNRVLRPLAVARQQQLLIEQQQAREYQEKCEWLAKTNLNGPHRAAYVALYKAAVHAHC